MAHYADAISDKTGIGRAFAGMLLLGGITSLPELGAVTTSAATGNAALAVNNLLGSEAINLVLLIVADALVKGNAVTAIVSGASVMLQGVLSVVLMAVLAIALATGDLAIGSVGLGSIVLAIGVVVSMRLASRYADRDPWRADRSPDRDALDGRRGPTGSARAPLERTSLKRLLSWTAGFGLAVVGGGYLLSISADGIAEAAGIDAGIIGMLLIGVATSLPELSTTTAAVRLGRLEMAIGDVFGTNIFNLAIFFVADLVFTSGPILGEGGGPFELVAILMAIVMTGVYLVGLLERRDRQLGRLGYDSLANVGVFLCGLAVLTTITLR